MSDLVITGGHNKYDPIRDAIELLTPGPTEVDPAVAARCTPIFNETDKLLRRLDSTPEPDTIDSVSNLQYRQSPAFGYDLSPNTSGYVWLGGHIFPGFVDLETLDQEHDDFPYFYLSVGIQPVHERSLTIMYLDVDQISNAVGNDSFKLGGHAELNFFQGVIAKMSAATKS
jgi:hypothetical protein